LRFLKTFSHRKTPNYLCHLYSWSKKGNTISYISFIRYFFPIFLLLKAKMDPKNIRLVSKKRSAPSFIFHKQSSIIYLLLYIDHIILASNNSSLLNKFTCKLNFEFATKDLGHHLSYFLCLKASLAADDLFISRSKYAWDILTRDQLLDNKHVHTLMFFPNTCLLMIFYFFYHTLYRYLVTALQYLTITRPYIAHVANSINQFLYALT
jgi:hypothetical protein